MDRSGVRADEADPAGALARRLVESGLTLAVAESCTGGLIAKRLTDRPGASLFFLGGVVAYHNEVKETVLGVRSATLESHGAVSGEVAVEMAEGVRRALGADAALAVTGIAGPDGGTAEKPVGTVWIAAALEGEATAVSHERFGGDRGAVREGASRAAMALLRRTIEARAG